ncbi:DUF7504 family protein [Halogeometricum limi]|uniref:DUF835 domain-containing protein n=1 Tax=Halogeometricum limi TaxID=555875 RepID=A0A1I6FUW1_9EURY|nr:hypothetical protein [Halogeometricum limi]SFR33676.1 hypothetical protein SAMN04488124_0339 [Halogeometricum limi]
MELSDRVTRETRDLSSVLVLRPQFRSGTDAACKRLLVGDADRVSVLGICFSRTPRRWYEHWSEALGAPPETAAVVTTRDEFGGDPPAGLTVETVSSPADLTGIGMQATKQLTAFGETDDAVAVSLDSLTLMLQYVSLETLYRFLHVLTGRIDALDATGLFLLDPTTQDPATVHTLKTLFHGVLAYDDEADDWTLQTQ